MSIIDFSSYPINTHRMYGGKNGHKVCVIVDGTNYMLKLPPKLKRNSEFGYTYGCISEHIACRIFSILGICSQQTMLGYYKDKIVVACKDFEEDGYVFKEFAHLKNTIIDSSGSGYGTELDDVLSAIAEQSIYPASKLIDFFWDMFVIDSLIGNFDRHNGNWGFLINESIGDVKIAPVFDCASSLYPSLDEKSMLHVLGCRDEINKRLFEFPRSAVKKDDIKICYASYLIETENPQCLNALLKFDKLIDLFAFDGLLYSEPLISDTHKQFLSTMLCERYNNILLPAINRAKEVGTA